MPFGVVPNNKSKKGGKAKSAPKSKKAVVALVKDVMAREIETKFRSQASCITQACNSAITNADILTCLPRLVQNQPNTSGSIYERAGTKISPKKLNIKAMINITPDIARSTNVVVCYYVLTHKSLKHFPDLAANQNVETHLFKTGDVSETYGMDGLYLNSTFPINDSEYVCLKQGKFLLGKNTGVLQDSLSTGNQPMYGNHLCKMLNFDIKCPAKLVYDQDSNSPRLVYYPNNFAPFIVFGYFHQDQSVADNVSQDITVTLRSSLWYDDA